MGSHFFYAHRGDCDTGITIIRPGVPVYTGICRVLFARSTCHIFTWYVLETNNGGSRTGRGVAYDTDLNCSEIFAGVDKRCFSRLSIPRQDDDHILCGGHYYDSHEPAKTEK